MSILPLYHRLFITLRDQIVNGLYDTKTPLPSEKALSIEFSASRATIRHALDLLEEEGLIIRHQGSRTYPRALGYKAAQRRRNLDLITRKDKHLTLYPGDIDQSFEIIKPNAELSQQFANAEKIGRLVRVRLQRGKPYCFVVTYMPLVIANAIDWENLGSKPVITAVNEAGYDFYKTEQVISAIVADEESAAAMHAPIGGSLFRISGLFIDTDDNAIMRKDGHFHPGSFEYKMTLYSNRD